MTTTETHEATANEWTDIIDRAAQFYLGMSGDAFVSAYEAGEFDADGAERDGVMAVLALLPPR